MEIKNVLFNMQIIIGDSSGFETPNPKIHYASSFYYYFSQSQMQIEQKTSAMYYAYDLF